MISRLAGKTIVTPLAPGPGDATVISRLVGNAIVKREGDGGVDATRLWLPP